MYYSNKHSILLFYAPTIDPWVFIRNTAFYPITQKTIANSRLAIVFILSYLAHSYLSLLDSSTVCSTSSIPFLYPHNHSICPNLPNLYFYIFKQFNLLFYGYFSRNPFNAWCSKESNYSFCSFKYICSIFRHSNRTTMTKD